MFNREWLKSEKRRKKSYRKFRLFNLEKRKQERHYGTPEWNEYLSQCALEISFLES